MNLKSICLTILLSVITSIAVLFLYHRMFSSKTAYLDIKKVFNEFLMKKELETKYKITEKERNKILDSLSFNLKVLSKHLNEQKDKKVANDAEEVQRYEYSREQFLTLQTRFRQDNEALSKKYDEQIFTQLTQYVIEFGKANNYDLIFGADGSGNLMYSKESYNVSDAAISFVNNKYKDIE